MLFVDEAHRLLNQRQRVGDGSEPTATLFLRDLMEDCKLGLVLAGTNVLDGLDKVDSHLGDRVSARHELCYFDADGRWMKLLKGFKDACKTFDLGLLEEHLEAKRLHVATGGSPRRLKRLVTEAVLVAADAGRSTLDLPSLAKAFLSIQGADSLVSNVRTRRGPRPMS